MLSSTNQVVNEREHVKDQFTPQVPDYRVNNYLGKGAFGYVLEAEDRTTGKKYAWKRSVKVTNNMSREIEVLVLMRSSPNVIRVENFFFSRNHADQIVQNIILEIGESDVEKYLYTVRKGNPLSLNEAKQLMRPIISGVRDLHAQGICHRDLKP